MSMTDTVLILHGWGGNKPAHWQEHLYSALTAEGVTDHYPKMPDPMAPNLAAWQDRLRKELLEIRVGPPLTVVCHSLGAINWMHYAATVNERIADRVLLVAPPYVIPRNPR